MKHLSIRMLFIQDLVSEGWIEIHRVPTKDNIADLMTKVNPAVCHYLHEKIDMASLKVLEAM